MEQASVFIHRLDLGLRLSDAVSGRSVPGRAVQISIGGRTVLFGEKDGVLTLQNLEHRTFLLHIASVFYEPLEISVSLDALEDPFPLLELPLIPGSHHPEFPELLALEGILPGIGSLSAIRPEESVCLFRSFDPRTQLMTVFNPHQLVLCRPRYALADPEEVSYEPFQILEMRDAQTLKIDRVPEGVRKNRSRICPLISGRCEPGGRYRLLVPRGGRGDTWRVRYLIDGQPRFHTIDLSRQTALP